MTRYQLPLALTAALLMLALLMGEAQAQEADWCSEPTACTEGDDPEENCPTTCGSGGVALTTQASSANYACVTSAIPTCLLLIAIVVRRSGFNVLAWTLLAVTAYIG